MTSYCRVCGGSGLTPVPHVPSAYGGYLDTNYVSSGMACGGCDGSGYSNEERVHDDVYYYDDDKDDDYGDYLGVKSRSGDAFGTRGSRGPASENARPSAGTARDPTAHLAGTTAEFLRLVRGATPPSQYDHDGRVTVQGNDQRTTTRRCRCDHCGAVFSSRNKLFQHLRQRAEEDECRGRRQTSSSAGRSFGTGTDPIGGGPLGLFADGPCGPGGGPRWKSSSSSSSWNDAVENDTEEGERRRQKSTGTGVGRLIGSGPYGLFMGNPFAPGGAYGKSSSDAFTGNSRGSNDANDRTVCKHCGVRFGSRNKLFSHLDSGCGYDVETQGVVGVGAAHSHHPL